MITPANYYNRFDDDQNYDEHLFIAGRVLQSAEMNEIQAQHNNRLKKVADVLFKDGDIIRDASISVDSDTGVVTCQSGAIYIKGAVRGVPSAILEGVSMTGTVAVGVRLVETVITEVEDPYLRDPAAGERGYYEPGAYRLQVTPTWGTASSGSEDAFFPVYTITDGQLDAKEPPPNLDAITQALARYDRDSAGGCYVVSGMTVKQLADIGANQSFTIAEGRARVYGFGVEYPTARRVALAAVPDLKQINNEPHLSLTTAAQRINYDRPAGTNPTVSITTEKTVENLTHGISTGAQDTLPDTSVLAILEVKQGNYTYIQNTDYKLTAGRVDWSLPGAEPSPGSTYTVTYQYITLVTPTAVDDTGLTVAGAVVGTQILVSYQQKLPRIDRLCINQDGSPVWVLGVSAEYNPQPPTIPNDMLALARVYQTWMTATRSVVNDGVRVVPMPQLYAIDSRLDWLAQLIAQNRLESSIHTREAGTKKGLFVDPFLDDSQRDAGTPQTGAVVSGELRLPIAATIAQVESDIISPQSLPYTHAIALQQKLRTSSMLINPYMAFAPVPAELVIRPTVDRWTNVETSWASAVTSRFTVGSGDRSSAATNTRNALLSTTTSNIETLRPITVAYTISRFGPGEFLTALTFDGVSVLSGTPVADGNGVVSGSFTIPAGIPSGSKQVHAVGGSGTVATAIFTGQGTLERQVWQQQTTITETRWQSPPPPSPPLIAPPVDPLAQTFTLPDNIQASGIDLWFVAKPTSTTRVQLRATSNGFPTSQIIAEAVLQPADINIGGAPTRFAFPYPVYLVGGSEYAIVVLCNDAIGSVSVAELGKFDAVNQRWITSQPYTVGVLLSSSNASTWTAHQDRDLTFRLLKASYTSTNRTIALGSVAVSAVTDLLLMSYAERPHSSTGIEYRLTLPDSSVVSVADGQPVQLAAAITGSVAISAILTGSTNFSPVLFPGTQLVNGVVSATGTYVSRAIPGGNPVTVKVILQAIVPSGSSLVVEYKGQDVGDAWTAVPQVSAAAADDGFTEVTYSLGSVNEINGVQLRLTLAGNTAARPRIRDLRSFVI